MDELPVHRATGVSENVLIAKVFIVTGADNVCRAANTSIFNFRMCANTCVSVFNTKILL